ncbi:thioesterase domain-containing protein, partial [Gynuella sp.]|uniref:thioesterase domain-containing protein n=1 Tax=Gynuella sp. TaxID=2969146 RepID=UPI003D0DA1FF
YMQPSSFTRIESIPLTANGKLDRQALPEPVWVDEDSYQAPETDLQQQLCDIWQQVLGLEQVGIQDNFYHLGGNSMATTRLVSLINEQFNCQLSLADAYTHPTIAQLSGLLSVPQRDLSLVKTLAFSQPESPTLFMIHPALAGCEVYYSLAVTLSSHFNCYGLDNHNLLNKDKIETLSDMAKTYLQAIEETYALSQTVYLLGWSLGGQVALEIAAILEGRGFKDIQVFLLDSFLPAGHFELRNYDIKSGMAQVLRNNGYEENQIESALDNIMVEQGISASKLSRDLIYTNVTLFKACHASPDEYRIHEEGLVSMETDMLNARDNFLSTSVKTEVSIYRLEQRHHYDLLDEKELISSVLFQSLPQPVVEEMVDQLALS